MGIPGSKQRVMSLPDDIADHLTWHPVSVPAAVQEHEDFRKHICIEGRYISVIRHKKQWFAIDSLCYHAGGPLGMGDIEDLPLQDGSVVQCITCPWHDFKLSICDGHKYLHTAAPGVSASPTADAQWKSTGRKQRVHHVRVSRNDDHEIEVALSGATPTTSNGSTSVASDVYATDRKFGQRLLDNVSVGDAPVGRVATGTPRRRSSSGAERVHLQS